MNARTAMDGQRRRRFWGRVIKWSLVAMIVPPLVGLAPTVWRLVTAFSDLEKSGQADPEALAEGVSSDLLTTMWGVSAACPAAVLLLIALIRYVSLPGAVPEKNK